MPQEREFLTRAAESYRDALELYAARGELRERLDQYPSGAARAESGGTASRGTRQSTGEGTVTVGVTLVSAADRQLAAATAGGRRIGTEHLLLASTSLLAMIALLLAATGRLERSEAGGPSTPASVIDLNGSVDAGSLEPALTAAFAHQADRRLAAATLASFITTTREAGDFDHVAELLRARVPSGTIDRTAGLVELKDRLARARQDARNRDAAAPASVPAITSADLAAIKPSFIVRTSEAFARQAATWTVLYVLAFWALAGVWWYRGVHADAVLVAAAHLLTAVGLAVMLTRPDPLRDTLLFVRFAQTVIVAVMALACVSLLHFRKAAFLCVQLHALAGSADAVSSTHCLRRWTWLESRQGESRAGAADRS